MDDIPGYNGRRAPNVSQYIANLNTIPSAQEMSPQGQDGYNFEADLAVFTNTQFFDFDLGEVVDAAPVPVVPAKVGHDSQPNLQGELGFLNGEYQFPDLPSFENLLDDRTGVVPSPIQTQNSPVYPTSSNLSSPAATSSGNGPVISPRTGDKPKADATKVPASLEEASRLAAEEDKRRRNTAASARFRVKKKQREQTLERTAKEMSEKVAQLETRIGQLETENKWLKNLITEKNENKDDIADLWRRFNKEGTSVLRRSSASSTTPNSSPSTTERREGAVAGTDSSPKTTTTTNTTTAATTTTSEVRTVDST